MRGAIVTVAGIATLAAAAITTTAPAGALGTGTGAADEVQQIAYAGVTVEVPAAWPVVDLGQDPTACLRLDLEAVYLGLPGPEAQCPAVAVGRGTTVQVLDARQAAAAEAAGEAATTEGATADDASTELHAPDGRVVRIRSGARSAVVDQVAASVRFGAAPTTPAPLPPADRALADAPVPVTAGSSTRSPRATAIQDGFDTCAAPSSSTMDAWAGSSPFSAVGVYIGGGSRACAQPNLTAAWVGRHLDAGWSLIPIYVGRQAPCTSYGLRISTSTSTAAVQGTSAADDAAALAKGLGLGAGTPIYLDIEHYEVANTGCNDATMAFASAWTARLHAKGYRSGVYGSASSAPYALSKRYSTPGFNRPDAIWIARWDGIRSDHEALFSDALWAGHRIKQYRGDHAETWGGAKLLIDTNFVNGDVSRRTATPVPTNLLADPSWEQGAGLASWPVRIDGEPVTSTVTAPGAHQGSSWARLTAPTGGGTTVGQDVTTTTHVGERYTFTAWVRSADGTPATARLRLAPKVGTTPPATGAGTTADVAVGADWVEVSTPVDVYATGTGLRATIASLTPDVAIDVDDASLLGSPAFAPFPSWDDFVARQRFDFAGSPGTLDDRQASVDQLALWSLTPTAYIQRLMRGSWFGGHVAPVSRLYRAYFGRIPDYGGATYWAGKHRSGMRLRTISQAFATSSEYERTYGSLTDAQFLDQVYRSVLGRPADPEGERYWTAKMARGFPRGEVMVAFSESSEYVRTSAAWVNTFEVYAGMLGRAPSADEQAAGATLPTYLVIDGVRRSPEYLARVA